MTNKVYRSARGKLIDMGALTLQNEQVRAVGNMNVNARGDRIDANGNVIDEKNRRIQRQIQGQTSSREVAHPSAPRQAKPAPMATGAIPAPVAEIIPGIDTAPTPASVATESTQGLAGALVRAKKNKQTPTPTEE